MNKVAVLCLSHFTGGMELDAIKYNQLFNRYGLDSILVCRKDTFIEQEAIKAGEQCFPIAFKKKFSLALIRGLRQLIQQQQLTDIVFFGTSEIKSIYFAVRDTGCRVHVRYGTTMSSPKKDFIHRWLYSCVSNHVAISEHLKRNVLEIMPVESGQTHTIFTPFSELQDDQPNLDQSVPKLIHVGRVAEGKGQESAIQALGLSDNKDQLSICFYGGSSDKKYLDKLQSLARSLDVDAQFMGHSSDVYAKLKEANVFLFPSAGEGLANVLIEALSMGLVCITFDNTVFPEFKDLGFYLHLIPDGDHQRLASKITEVTTDLAKELERSQHNVLLCERYFGAESIVDQWKLLLNQPS